MGLFEHFPYANFHELNLDIICQKVKELEDRMNELPDEIKAEIEPQIINWIQQYLQDSGIYVDSGILKILESNPSSFAGTISKIQVGDEMYNINDPDLTPIVAQMSQDMTDLYDQVQDIDAAMPVGTVETFRDCRFYVDPVNGDDDNNGGSIATAFRTLDRAFEEFSKYASLWIYLEAGNEDYPVTKHGVFSGHTLHITAEYDGCRIVFRDPDTLSGGIPVYNSHWNLKARNSAHKLYVKCYEQLSNVDSHLYFDNTLLTIENVEFEDYIGFYGSTFTSKNSTLKYANFENSCVTTETATAITNKDPAQYALRFDNCQVNLTGTFSTDSLDAAGTAAAYLFRSSDAFVGSVIVSNQTNNYDHAIDADQGSRVVISAARLTTIDGYCANASTTAQGASIDTYS